MRENVGEKKAMTDGSKLVRASRDGDQFHYLWTARRCLRMLRSSSNLKAVSVEGPTPESSGGIPDQEVIDVAEYYGTEQIATCERIEYVQLKHSTLRTEKPWTLSELKDTLRRFAGIFRSHCKEFGPEMVRSKIRFRIVSNRRFGPSILVNEFPGSRLSEKARTASGLSGNELSIFVELLFFAGAEGDYLGQRDSLRQDLNGYLAENDADVPVRLRDLVADRALSHNSQRNVIRWHDLLGALQTSSDDLLPSPNLIQDLKSTPRKQETALAKAIMESRQPVVIDAPGGTGKSILSMRLPALLPPGSVSIVYDCFGNGSYRQAGHPRHNAQQGLVQIVNELAAHGLCEVLIPSQRVSRDRYFRVFEARLKQSSELLEAHDPSAVICLIVDAADNAEMAARELGEEPSFIRSLLRVPLPSTVRLVALCRSERRYLLDLPSTTLKKKLDNFDKEESAAHLRSVYPASTDAEAQEFHRLTSANPRVQAAVLAEEDSLSEVLASLGVTPRSVDDSIASVLERAVGRLLDSNSSIERSQIETLAAAIATLRPFVPLDVVAKTANVDVSFVESFASDLGRPLLVSDRALQFRDEPTETWFRERYKPKDEQLRKFLAVIEGLAADYPYAASTLPQLLLEAGEENRLIELALSGDALPKNPAERRTIEVQRVLFALKASLRAKRYVDAAKLALKAAQEVTGVDRQLDLLAKNLDLVAALWPPDRVRELAGTHSFSGNWLGARHVYEAALYARLEASSGEARSQLRMANDWLMSWANQADDKIRGEDVTDLMRTEMAEVAWRLDGPSECVRSITRWRSGEVHFLVGKLLARRALDGGRVTELEALLRASSKHLELALGLILEINRNGGHVEKRQLISVIRQLKSGKLKKSERLYWHREERMEAAIVAVTEIAIRTGADRSRDLGSILEPILGARELYHFGMHDRQRRSVLIRAFVLQSRLRGELPTLERLAPQNITDKLGQDRHRDDRDMREFREGVGSLLPWHILYVENLFDPIPPSGIGQSITSTRQSSSKALENSYGRDANVSDEIGILWTAILSSSPVREESLIQELVDWASRDQHCRFIPTWVDMVRLATLSSSMSSEAYPFAQKAKEIIERSTLDAESRADSYIDIARALFRVDRAEASSLLDSAVVVASKLGYDATSRWMTILDLADAAAGVVANAEALAYRTSRCAELVHEYESKHFDWKGTIHAINGISPASGIAIVSRWHDRRFGFLENTLALAFQDLWTRRVIQPSWIVPFLWFKADWAYGQTIQTLLENIPPETRSDMFARALRPLGLERRGTSLWKDLRSLAQRYFLPTDFIDERIRLGEEYENTTVAIQRDQSQHYEISSESKDRADAIWRKLELAEKLYSANDMSFALSAWHRESKSEFRLSKEDFIDLMFRDAKPEKAVSIIESFATSSADQWECMMFFQKLPSQWKCRQSVVDALTNAAGHLAKRFCLGVFESRFYEPTLFSVLHDVSKISKREIAKIAMSSLAEMPVLDDSGSLFKLVGLIAQNLSNTEAASALDFGLSLLEDQLTTEIGDGPWHEELRPDTDIEEAIAGFLYAKLASPIAGLRWQAVHVIVEAGRDETSLISHLVSRDEKEHCQPYVDGGLVFYVLHARLWLLIALERLGKERVGPLARHIGRFAQLALSEDHVLIRHFAREVALRAISDDRTAEAEAKDKLEAVNVSPFPPVISESYERSREKLLDVESDYKGFIFGYDMDRYWFEPLDRAFGLPKGTAMRSATQIADQQWGARYTGRWQDDARAQGGIFREQETWYSHGEYPGTDDLSFYLSYHALMMTAGELVRTRPSHQDPESRETAFSNWLKEHLPTRPDGFLLSDGRDPEPLGLIGVSEELQDEAWRWQVQRSDFSRCLTRQTDQITLLGRWQTVRGRRVEKVEITSFLVATDKAPALKRALQASGDPYRYRFPGEDDEYFAVAPGFQIFRWLDHKSEGGRLDKADPWSGNINYETFELNEHLKEHLPQPVISDGRTWTQLLNGEESRVLGTTVWGSAQYYEPTETPISSGKRVEAAPSFLLQLLSVSSLTMIVKITIEREVHKEPYEKKNGDEYVYIPPYFIYYVYDEGGSIARF